MIKLNKNTQMRYLKQFSITSFRFSLAMVVLLLGACQKELVDDPAPVSTPAANENLAGNDWILENMQLYYFWNDKIPANPDKTKDPEGFFNSLLYSYNASTRPDGDRFSFMALEAQELQASLSGQERTTGAEYTFYLASQGSNDVIAQVMYVLPASPAQRAGLKRGDIIYQINGQTLTRANYYSLLFEQSSLVFGLGSWQNNQLVKGDQTVSITTEVFQENPVFLDSVYTLGSSKIGYLVYNQFIPAPNGSKTDTYDQQIDQIFSSFQAAGVNELILDLRYNPGGYVSSATNLASLIGKGIDETKVFYTQEYNLTIKAELEDAYGEDFFVEKFTTKAQNIGNQLSRVFVLTSGQTASASELIINGLKPYMNVVTIGSTTVGKNVGSITITDDTGKVKYGLQPIVFKSYNSLGQSDYTAGFTPNVESEESIELKPLGDTEETMLNAALNQITGAPLARRGISESALPVAGSSVARKAGGSNMFDGRIKNLPVQ